MAEGVTGLLQTRLGARLPFRITSVDPGRSWEWAVAGIPATGHTVTELDNERSLVEFSVPWITAPYLVVLRRALLNIHRLAKAP